MMSANTSFNPNEVSSIPNQLSESANIVDSMSLEMEVDNLI